jgi:tripartite ATP-independent transporter DctM subunit
VAAFLAALMFPVVFLLLPLGFPVALTVIGVAISFAALGQVAGVFDVHLLSALPLRLQNLMDNDILQAIPLFIYMGAVMERTRLARDLFGSIGALFGERPGGLAAATLIVGVLIAPTTGAIGATVVALGLLALPPMLSAGYDRRFASGITAATGTLGAVLPPSILLILLGDQMRIALAAADQLLGRAATRQLLFKDIYLGMAVPVAFVIAGYVAIVVMRSVRQPETVPAQGSRISAAHAVVTIVPPLTIIAAALFLIATGRVYTVEAAGGAALAFTILALLRGELTARTLGEIVQLVARVSGAMFLLITGAQTFSIVFRGFGGGDLVHQALVSSFGSAAVAVPAVFAMLLIFGFFLDAIEIIFLVVPIAIPPLIVLGADPLWLAVLVGVTLQTSFLLPPSGFALFFMDHVRRNIAADDITMRTIYAGARPFVLVQIAILVAVLLVPALATALPSRV